jgi:hypothetical protein
MVRRTSLQVAVCRLQSMTNTQAPMTIQARMTECPSSSCLGVELWFCSGLLAGNLRHLHNLRIVHALAREFPGTSSQFAVSGLSL